MRDFGPRWEFRTAKMPDTPPPDTPLLVKKRRGPAPTKKERAAESLQLLIRPGDEAWDRLYQEPSRQFRAFCYFRDHPREDGYREYKRTSEALKIPLYQISDWSYRWYWGERCQLYDAHLDRVARAAREAALVKMIERHAEASEEMVRLAREHLTRFRESGKLLGPTLIQLFLSEGIRLERLSRGLYSDVTRTERREEHLRATKVDATLSLLASPKATELASQLLEELSKMDKQKTIEGEVIQGSGKNETGEQGLPPESG